MNFLVEAGRVLSIFSFKFSVCLVVYRFCCCCCEFRTPCGAMMTLCLLRYPIMHTHIFLCCCFCTERSLIAAKTKQKQNISFSSSSYFCWFHCICGGLLFSLSQNYNLLSMQLSRWSRPTKHPAPLEFNFICTRLDRHEQYIYVATANWSVQW